MTEVVRIRTGARLHFGLWAINAPTGRRCGGVGMMIAEPVIELTAQPAERDWIAGCSEEIASRVALFLRRLRAVRPNVPRVGIGVSAAIASHQGLGSGTQLALATAAAVLNVAGDKSFDAAAWAHQLGRGERSSIGVYGFEAGGFLVEAGQEPGEPIGERIGRTDVCEDWRIALIAPPQTVGLSGAAEQTAFERLPPMSEATTAELHRIAMDQWLPAMTAADLETAARAMWDYGQRAGEYFRAVQGGVFASPRMEALSHELRQAGYAGIAQTSWGPTIAVLCRHADEAESLRQRVLSQPGDQDLSVRITRPLNVGAAITTEARGLQSLGF
jgi:beta-ribofuranosylaminobenzene 5'-phosphate synthase